MLVAISAAHGRHAVTRAWIEHMLSLSFDQIYVAVTDDADNAMNYGELVRHNMRDNHPVSAWFMPNNPLSDKFNSALSVAMDDGAERIMVVPSDDFVSHAWVRAMRETDEPYCIAHTCAILDAYSQQCYAIRKLSLNPGGTMKFGAGRVVSRKVVEACGGQLWPNELNKGLDSASHARISRAGFTVKVVETEGIPITDLKTEENLWPWQTWQHSGRPCTADEALHMVSPEVRARIDAMKR